MIISKVFLSDNDIYYNRSLLLPYFICLEQYYLLYPSGPMVFTIELPSTPNIIGYYKRMDRREMIMYVIGHYLYYDHTLSRQNVFY